MTILLEDSMFLHIPKTAGSSLRVLFSASCTRSFYHLSHSEFGSHLTLSHIDSLSHDPEFRRHISVLHPDLLLSERDRTIVLEPLVKGFKPKIFAFVRHPVQWWGSYWAYRQTEGWTSDHPIDVHCRADHFETFIENVLRTMPGYCSRMMREFVGYDRNAVIVGRHESLERDLDTMLRIVGFAVPFKRSTPIPKINVSDPAPRTLSAGLEAELNDAERDIVNEFYSGVEDTVFEAARLESKP